jgi:hypothetical protein
MLTFPQHMGTEMATKMGTSILSLAGSCDASRTRWAKSSGIGGRWVGNSFFTFLISLLLADLAGGCLSGDELFLRVDVRCEDETLADTFEQRLEEDAAGGRAVGRPWVMGHHCHHWLSPKTIPKNYEETTGYWCFFIRKASF